MSKWRGNTRHMRNGVKMPSQTSVLTSSFVMPFAEMPDAWHDNDRHGKPKVLESCPWSVFVIYRFCSVHMSLHVSMSSMSLRLLGNKSRWGNFKARSNRPLIAGGQYLRVTYSEVESNSRKIQHGNNCRLWKEAHVFWDKCLPAINEFLHKKSISLGQVAKLPSPSQNHSNGHRHIVSFMLRLWFSTLCVCDWSMSQFYTLISMIIAVPWFPRRFGMNVSFSK